MLGSKEFYFLFLFGLGALLIWWIITISPPRLQKILSPAFVVTLGFFAYQYIPWNYWINVIRAHFSPVL